MGKDPLFYVAVAAVLVVLVILLMGLGTFGRGGEFNRKHANRLMRWRLIAQFVAVVVIVGYALLRARGGG